MKKLFVLAILLTPLSLGAKDPKFVKTFGGPQIDRILATVEVDEKLIFGGSKDADPGPSKGWLFATDASGAVLFDRTYEDPAGRSAQIFALARGASLFAGGFLSSFEAGIDVFVMALTDQGEVLWQSELQAEGDQVLTDLVALSDGGLLIVGATIPPGQTKRDGWVVKIDAQGSIEWQKAFRTDGDDAFETAVEEPAGRYLLGGQVGIFKAPDNFQAWIVSLDSGGNVLWERGYEIASSDRVRKLLPVPGGFVALGTAFELAFFRGEAWILEIDDAGTPVSSRLVGDFQLLGHDEFVDGVAGKNGGFVALGNTDTVAGPSQQYWAVEFNAKGRPVWARHFGGGGYDVASAMVETRVNTVVLAGWSQPLFDAVVVKTGTRGDGSSSCDLIGALDPEPYDFAPTTRARAVTETVTGAVPVAGGLLVGSSPTAQTSPCAF